MFPRKFYLMLLFCLPAAALAQLQELPRALFCLPFNEASIEDLRGLGLEQSPKAHNPEFLKWIRGPEGKTLYFDNDGQNKKRGMISCQLPPNFDVDLGFSVTAFIKTPPDIHTSRQYEILNFSDGKRSGFRVKMSWRMLWLSLGDGDETRSVRSNSSMLGINLPQSWYHIAAVYDGHGGGKVYLNGILLGSGEGIRFKMPEKRKFEMRVGASNSKGSGYGFEGCISALRFYNLPLSVEQINTLAHME